MALSLFVVALSSFVSPARAAEDLPEQTPGVTLRTYDVGVELSGLCTLKPGQTPNVDKLMPSIDWTSDADFGLTDKFVTQVIANINITTAGSHTFRLTSDDGARLTIGDKMVIENDGRHAPTSKDGSIELAAGYHSLRIDHFDHLSEQRLRLEWRKPGSSQFELVPQSVLSTDKGVVRVTAPGRKECVGGSDEPGDGMPLNAVHPDYKLTNLRPSGFEPQVGGMDWLPDGRLAITTWGGSEKKLGEVYLLDHVTGTTSPDQVTTKKIASGLQEPMGIKYVDGKLYVAEKSRLVELNDTNGDEVADDLRTVATWPFSGNFHEFAFGLLYKDGDFYLNKSVAINFGGATTDPQPAQNRGTTIKVNKATGKVETLAGGLRTPNGIGWGPEDGIFATDNQGGWLPASKLVHIKPGRFFNHYTNPAGPFDDKPVTQPVLWLPQNEIGNSPSNPIHLKEGPFAGQMLIGDVTYGGIQRAFLEKVNGEYQGAVFRFTQGLEAGVNRISVGPDGAIYAGGIGGGGNWGQEGKLNHGLQKLTPNGNNAFDIKAMRAVDGGFEFEYTQPLSAETANALKDKYKVKQWRYEPTAGYGGPKVDEKSLSVDSATLSVDRKKVTVKIADLKPGHVVHVRSPRPFSSESGKSLWSTEAWYTLNATPNGSGTDPRYEAESAQLSGGAAEMRDHQGYTGNGFVAGYGTAGASTQFTVNAESAGTYNVGLRYSNGPHPFTGTKTISVYVNGTKAKQVRLADTGSWDKWATQVEALDLKAGANTITYKRDGDDSGHVNLDHLTVAKAQRIDLFNGGNLDAWEKTTGGAATWPIANGSMESAGGDIRTKQKFGDFKLHAEWLEPNYPSDVTGQQRGNSGVYLQERYEIQVLDSYGDTTLTSNEAGGIYSKRAADRNMATAPGTWQTYDITFRAARYNSDGKKVDDARVTVKWNGEVVHKDVAIDGVTGGSIEEGPSPASIRLQDHGDPGENPRFRNIWIEPIA
ncbi:PA14 domain-containing protein [Streptomyces davaonensis JCM 4913]|uniref:PA14 domain-containing protein n=1 Tax=Streptomyces davaonensis (strain DSM 101723 / JCM 4913 / KCC S-0913 / 768) TaxID=1214101 RepID=K4R1C9_STRDJ|nr:PA14 domain-containing protein [Streptomyces davaonensis JCM 4913]